MRIVRLLTAVAALLALTAAPAQAEKAATWQRLTTDAGCIFYLFGPPSNDPTLDSYRWSEPCTAGRAIGGSGTLEKHRHHPQDIEYTGEVWVWHGTLVNGAWQGPVSRSDYWVYATGSWDSAKPDKVTSENYSGGCSASQAGGCSPGGQGLATVIGNGTHGYFSDTHRYPDGSAPKAQLSLTGPPPGPLPPASAAPAAPAHPAGTGLFGNGLDPVPPASAAPSAPARPAGTGLFGGGLISPAFENVLAKAGGPSDAAKDPTPVSECISVAPVGAGYGLRNSCNFAVEVHWCVLRPEPNSWAVGLACEQQKFGSEKLSANSASPGHVGGGAATYWFACRSPQNPEQARFEPGKGIVSRCHVY